jgi:hypothetical protein
MKAFSAAALAALEAGDAVETGAIAIHCTPPLRIWGGWETLIIDDEPYVGMGAEALFEVSSGALGGAEQNIVVTVSGVDPATKDVVDAGGLQGAAAVLHRLVFDSSGQFLLDARVFDRGRVDQAETIDVIGVEAAIRVSIETAARGLARRGGRMRTDTDQRLIKATDGSHRAVAYAAKKNLYWGGPRPATAGSAFGSGRGGAGSGQGLNYESWV